MPARIMLLLAALPVALRLLLLRRYPIPSPGVSDDFSYLLLADTLRHFRLANPTHALHQFFETFFVLQEPTYSSIFPIGQGLALAIGWMLFGHPWAGVALSIGAFCALCYWMLRGWVSPGWALLGGVLAAMEFGPLNQWMNSYWGGAVSACAGCLVFGALPRLRERPRIQYALLLGAGLGVQILTRPYESIFLALSAGLFLAPFLRDRKILAAVVLAVAPAIALTLLQNKAVTGSWTSLPYMASRYQYGVPATFTFQPNPVPHRELTPEQRANYEIQSATHSDGAFLERYAGRVRFYRFFFLAPLYLAIPFFLLNLKEWRYRWVLATVLIFSIGTNFYPYFYSHYIAALASLFVLMSVAGLQRLSRVRGDAARLIVFLCVAHFVFWYGLQLFGSDRFIESATQYETWDAINHGDPDGRIAIADQLAREPGRHLVFVRYWPGHKFKEWVHNGADIDALRVVWARDLGEPENEKLRHYYPTRNVWLLEPDARPRPKLTAWSSPPSSSPTDRR